MQACLAAVYRCSVLAGDVLHNLSSRKDSHPLTLAKQHCPASRDCSKDVKVGYDVLLIEVILNAIHKMDIS
eukprot:1592164-Amphidinium_carterae.2